MTFSFQRRPSWIDWWLWCTSNYIYFIMFEYNKTKWYFFLFLFFKDGHRGSSHSTTYQIRNFIKKKTEDELSFDKDLEQKELHLPPVVGYVIVNACVFGWTAWQFHLFRVESRGSMFSTRILDMIQVWVKCVWRLYSYLFSFSQQCFIMPWFHELILMELNLNSSKLYN